MDEAAPLPNVHDEFAYLLAADTFLLGRLANPQSPLASAFESFHVLVRPTYASKYPPGLGLTLAAGSLVGGRPIIGVWATYVAACAGLAWAFRPFVGPRWALFGGLGAALSVGGTYWVQSYWGGCLPLLGAAVTIGGARRAWERPTLGAGVVFGLGPSLLMLSWPYEGLVLAGPITLALGLGLALRRPIELGAVLAGGLLPLLPSAFFLGAVNFAVTGSPWSFPYEVWLHKYGWAPCWVFQTPLPRAAAFAPEHALFQAWEYTQYGLQDSWEKWAWYQPQRIGRMLGFLGLPTVGLLALPLLRRDPWMGAVALQAALSLVGLLLTVWFLPHYGAVFDAVLMLLWLGCVRALVGVRLGRWPAGAVLAAGLSAGWIGAALQAYVAEVSVAPRMKEPGWVRARERIRATLAQKPGRPVVFVAYGATHSPHEEWVYNGAEPGEAAVTWARDLGPAANLALLDAWPDAHGWRVSVDGGLDLQPIP